MNLKLVMSVIISAEIGFTLGSYVSETNSPELKIDFTSEVSTQAKFDQVSEQVNGLIEYSNKLDKKYAEELESYERKYPNITVYCSNCER